MAGIETKERGRKIPLNTSIYCAMDVQEVGGVKGCDHDYNPEPTRETDTSATWRCTRCGIAVTFGVWD